VTTGARVPLWPILYPRRLNRESTATKRIFTYEEALALWPEVKRITSEAVEKVEEIDSEDSSDYEEIVTAWAEAILAMGIEVKGLWLIDFDNGSGYYCWRHPEPALEYFHTYEEGFGGRVKLN
jgi:hypothetical protein